jgi:hypothetical protein
MTSSPRHRLVARLAGGALAGAAGTTALNATTFLDMAARGRPASSTPEETVERLLGLVGLEVPGDDEQRKARTTAPGSLLGALAGVSAGVAVGAIRSAGRPRSGAGTFLATAAAGLLVGNAPMTLLRVTDPRTWSATDWLADVVPHLAYAAAATATFEALDVSSARSAAGRAA